MTYMRTDRYRPNERVRVLAPGDPNHRQVGTVRRTFADAGHMVHVLDFGDGTTDRYVAEDLQALNAPVSHRRDTRLGPLPPLVRCAVDDLTEDTPREQD